MAERWTLMVSYSAERVNKQSVCKIIVLEILASCFSSITGAVVVAGIILYTVFYK